MLCLANARWKFDESTKVSGGSPAAREFIAVIQKIYRREKELCARDLSDVVALRSERALPLIDQLNQKLEKKSQHVAPSTAREER